MITTNVLPMEREGGRGWLSVLGAAIGYGMGPYVVMFYTLSTFMVPLSEAFGWTRVQISSATLLSLAATLIGLPIVGRLADRFGARAVVLMSLPASALCVLAFTAMNGNIWLFYTIWFLLMLVGAGTSANVWMRGVVGWFDRRRGLAIGVTMTGAGLCGALAPPLLDMVIRTWGWHGGYVMVASAAAGIALPVALIAFREAPATLPRAHLKGNDSSAWVERPAAGVMVSNAIRTRRFWQLGIGMIFTGGALGAFVIHLVPLITDNGLDRHTAVRMASLLGIAAIVSRFVVGWLIDYVFAPFVAGVMFLLVACFMAVIAITAAGNATIMVLSIIAVGAALGEEGNVVSFLTARYFGMRSFSEITAWMLSGFMLGQGLFPLGAAMLYERTGSYRLALLIGCGMLVASAALFATLGRYPDHLQHAQ